jgi:hypothetical protein
MGTLGNDSFQRSFTKAIHSFSPTSLNEAEIFDCLGEADTPPPTRDCEPRKENIAIVLLFVCVYI